MNKVFIPTKLVSEIENYILIESDFTSITEKQSNNLKRKLITLWYFIYTEQINNTKETLELYTNISKHKLENFNIKISNKRYKYRDLILILEKINLIEVNDKYSSNTFTKSYKIITDFLNESNYTEIEIDFEKVFQNFKNKEYWINKYPQFKEIIEDTYNTSIDLDSYLLWMKENIGKKLKPVIINGIVKERYLTYDRIFLHLNLALKINFQNNWFKLSNEGRLYSSISNLPYTSLPFIKMYRRNIVDIDIKNSQPLLLSTLVDNETYKNDVENGIFYDKVASELNMKRNDFKVLSYKHIFFSSKKLKSGKIYEILEKLYPSLISKINELKDKFNLAHKLQEMESEIFVNKLGKLPFKKLLRHDQVIIYKEDETLVKKYIINEYKKLGLNVNLG